MFSQRQFRTFAVMLNRKVAAWRWPQRPLQQRPGHRLQDNQLILGV